MKPYFENEGLIIPFEKVVCIYNAKSTSGYMTVEIMQINNYTSESQPYFAVPIDQLDNYKLWLENQSPDARKMVCNSEISNNWQPTIEQVNEIGNIINAGCDYCRCETCPDGCNYEIIQEKYQEIIEKLKEMENGK